MRLILFLGKPRPLLYWYRNNQLIDDQWTITAQGIVRNELFIPKLQRNDQGSLLSCQSLFNVSNESISEMFETKISSPATTTTMTTTTTNSAIQSSSWNPRDPDQIRQAMLANHLFVGHILDDDNNNNDNNNNSVRQKHKNLFRLKQSQSSILLELNRKLIKKKNSFPFLMLFVQFSEYSYCLSNSVNPKSKKEKSYENILIFIEILIL